MKLIFAGTPPFAATALHALLASAHEVIAVYTQPDRPAGRGLKLTPSAVKTLGLAHHLPVFSPLSLKDPAERAAIAAFNADAIIVAAYGLLLPPAVLTLARYGCINIHPSLLPRWRGAAPIQHTILAGDSITGVSIMQMDAGLDTGPVLLQLPCPVLEDETAQELHDRLAVLGADALLQTLALLLAQAIQPIKQQNANSTYAHKLSKQDALLDFKLPAAQLALNVRAFNPWPVAYMPFKDTTLRIWQAVAVPCVTHKHAPGTIVQAAPTGIDIATGDGLLRLLTLQLAGGKALTVDEFWHMHRQKFTLQ